MSDIMQVLESALLDEPAYTPDVAAILAEAHRRRSRRHAAAVTSVAGVGSGIAALAVAFVAVGSPHDRRDGTGPVSSARTSTSASTLAAPSSTPADRTLLTRSTLADLVEQLAGIRLSGVSVEVLPPTGDIDLAAGIASAQGQYLNVQVVPAGNNSSLTRPTCADLSGSGSDGDGYTGPCTVTPRRDHGYLVVRSGRTADGRFAKAQADLVTGDGAAVFVEATNQLSVPDPGTLPSTNRSLPPAVTHDPPLTSRQLSRLALALNARR